LFALTLVTALEKVRLAEVSVLALDKSKMTTGRRSSPVPQLTCRGKLCSEFTPASVLCTNMGSDGRDVQWKCESDMPDGYRFGSIDVSCEGYGYPDDPFILVGSCGLTYELEGKGTKGSHNEPHKTYRPYNDYSTPASTSYGSPRSGLKTWVGFAVVAVLVYAVYRVWKSGRVGGGGGHGWFRPDLFNHKGAPPPYSTGSTSTGSRFGTSTGTSKGPGFMSGAFAGGALGYLMGNRNKQHATNIPAARPAGATNHSPTGRSPRGDSNGGGGVRTGYAGTTRR